MPKIKDAITPKINLTKDKEKKSTCISLLEHKDGFRCMVMPGPPPLLADLDTAWEDTYESYCCRCERFLPKNIAELKPCVREMYRSRGWTCVHNDALHDCMKDCEEYLSSVFVLQDSELKSLGPDVFKYDL